MPFADTGVNNAERGFSRFGRRPNPVFSSEYGIVREVLIQARRQAGQSQRPLAARLEKTGSHVAMIERGQRRVDLLEFCRMADSLGLPAQELLRRIEERLRPHAAANAPGPGQAAMADAGAFAKAS